MLAVEAFCTSFCVMYTNSRGVPGTAAPACSLGPSPHCAALLAFLCSTWVLACGGDTSPPPEIGRGNLTEDGTDGEATETGTDGAATETDTPPRPPANDAGEPSPTDGPTDREPATGRRSIFVGNITQRYDIPSDFLRYWDQITPENEGKWASVERERDQMSWWASDRVYRFARDNGIPYKGHTLVWGQQAPEWLLDLSPREQAEEVEEWIREFCERYPDAEMIDVVNEPDHRPPAFMDAIGGAGATGHDWVIWSFRKAREYCPNSKLILNDYNVLRWDTDNFISIANKVKAEGLLDAIGCQAHGLEDQPFWQLEDNLRRIADIGVDVYISEYDINIADDHHQRQIMEEQFTLFYESPAVVGITLWGYIYGQTWIEHSGLIRDDRHRPAMTWLMDYLGR